MFSVVWYSMFIYIFIGYVCNIYNLFESNVLVIFDYSDDGCILKIFFLGIGCQVFYKYGKFFKLLEIVYDSIVVIFGYDEIIGVLKMVNF